MTDRSLSSEIPAGRPVFFGHPFDPDERGPALQEKAASVREGASPPDLYEAVMELVRPGLPAGSFDELGSLPVPGWLAPVPEAADVARLSVEESVAFIDGDGCRAAAEEVGVAVEERILPGVPAMIGVDHCATGGVVRRLAARYGGENLALVVLDAHTDALTAEATAGAIAYDAETNPRSVYRADDPYLHGRAESYNASSFLLRLLDEGVIPARNLCLAGVADYPPSRAFKVRDARIERYVGEFAALKKRGVTLITREEAAANPARVGWALRAVKTPFAYVSVDLDVGANAAVKAVRFRERTGLDEATVHRVLEAIAGDLLSRARLVGFDVMEFDARRAASGEPAEEPAFRIAARALTLLAEYAAAPPAAGGAATAAALPNGAAAAAALSDHAATATAATRTR